MKNYIHNDGMAGRGSEESLEMFNAVLAEIKRVLREMSKGK